MRKNPYRELLSRKYPGAQFEGITDSDIKNFYKFDELATKKGIDSIPKRKRDFYVDTVFKLFSKQVPCTSLYHLISITSPENISQELVGACIECESQSVILGFLSKDTTESAKVARSILDGKDV